MRGRKVRISIQKKLFYSHFISVLLVSGSIGTLVYRSAVDSLFASLQSRLSYSAALLSRAIDASLLGEIKGKANADDPAYLAHLQLLRDFKRSNQDIAFIYVMRQEGGRVYFVIDSDESPAQASPGDEYLEDVPALRQGFLAFSADDKATDDEWGTFLSGYAPLKNGQGRFLIGIDMRADEVERKFLAIRVAGAISLVLSILLAYVFSTLLARRIIRPIRVLVARTSEIAAGLLEGEVTVRTGDELEELADAFNKMSTRLKMGDEKVRQAVLALEEANDSLERRVAERTGELVELNRKLHQENAERRHAEEALFRAATTDYLTGLLNRPAVLRVIEQEIERASRSGSMFSLLLADIDRFKEVNDSFGHETGDRLLVAAGELLRTRVRGQDAVARWGGDELLVFLPDTPLEGARDVADKIRYAFAQLAAPVNEGACGLTVSIGVATFAVGESVDECVRRADTALLRAKSEGRNRLGLSAPS